MEIKDARCPEDLEPDIEMANYQDKIDDLEARYRKQAEMIMNSGHKTV